MATIIYMQGPNIPAEWHTKRRHSMNSIEEQTAKKVPSVDVDDMGKGGRQVDGVGYVVNSLGEDQIRNGSSKTDVPTYKE